MKRFGHVIVAAVLGYGFSTAHLSPVAHAAAITAHGEVAVPVKNVPAGLMAWWIDPKHNAVPSVLQAASSALASNLGGRGRGSAGGGGGRGGSGNAVLATQPSAGLVGPLPAGVESIKADIRTNTLLVSGTAEGVASLRKVVEHLDKPLQIVDMELNFVETNSAAALDALQLPFADTATRRNFLGTAISVDIKRDNGATLARLKADPQAQVRTFRLRTFNNTSARHSSETTELEVVGNATTPDVKSLVQRLSRLEFTATPTINHDGTITVALFPEFSTRLLGDNLSEEQKATVGQKVDTISNVKNGETLVVGGLKVDARGSTGGNHISGTADNKTPDAATNRREVLVFITPRIVPLELVK
jgi:type II secretory pathway component GspD/PulD (secretin)